MVPTDEQHANFDPLEDHVRALIAPAEEKGKKELSYIDTYVHILVMEPTSTY